MRNYLRCMTQCIRLGCADLTCEEAGMASSPVLWFEVVGKGQGIGMSKGMAQAGGQ